MARINAWLGTTDSDASVSANWSLVAIPSSGMDIVIDARGEDNIGTAPWAFSTAVSDGANKGVDLNSFKLTQGFTGDIGHPSTGSGDLNVIAETIILDAYEGTAVYLTPASNDSTGSAECVDLRIYAGDSDDECIRIGSVSTAYATNTFIFGGKVRLRNFKASEVWCLTDNAEINRTASTEISNWYQRNGAVTSSAGDATADRLYIDGGTYDHRGGDVYYVKTAQEGTFKWSPSTDGKSIDYAYADGGLIDASEGDKQSVFTYCTYAPGGTIDTRNADVTITNEIDAGGTIIRDAGERV